MKHFTYLLICFIYAVLITFLIVAVASGFNVNFGDTWNAVAVVTIFLLVFGGITENTFNNLEQREQFRNQENERKYMETVQMIVDKKISEITKKPKKLSV